jgi:Membrane-associated phospholipid phosphatase
MKKIHRSLAGPLLAICLCQFTLIPSLQAEATSLEKPQEISPDYQPTKKDLEFSQRSSTAENWTFRKIPRELGGTMKEAFWGWGGLGFGLGMGLTGALVPLDDNLQNSFDADALFGHTGNEIIGWTLSPYTIGGISLITWIVSANTNHPKLAMTTRALTEALFLSLSIDAIAKVSFRRERPDGGNFSFPSAHATAAFTAAGVLTTFYGWKAGLPSYALASLVSVSRIDSDSHFLTDVLAGAVLGTVIGVGAAKFQKKDNPQFFITPQVSHERASLNLTFIR